MACLKLRLTRIVLPLFLAFIQYARAATDPETNPWRTYSGFAPAASSEAWVQPDSFLAFEVDHSVLENILKRAGKESAGGLAVTDAVITLPGPDGTFTRFRFLESSVMAPELAAKFPEIRTFLGQGVNDPTLTVRFDLTPAGFHSQIISTDGASYIEPWLRGNANLHVCYFKRDYRTAAKDFQCFTLSDETKTATKMAPMASLSSLNGNLRTYRLACAATGEYTAYQGGTVSAGMAAIATAINRVTGIYESELGIRLVLVANNNLIVYTNSATDPYTDNNPSLLLSQNQSNLDAVIGTANYDVGHVFGTAGGGLAGVGVVCIAGLKAHGETGIYPPTGDAFWVDYVAHEMGHQFGASHTFNSTNSGCSGNRCSSTAYEPGSGSTIMAYAGVCGSDNLQIHSGPYFHSRSFEQIEAYVLTGGGSAAGTTTSTGNHPPQITAGTNYVIPAGTPFTLAAAGNDPDGDSITWCWEERDLGPALSLVAPDNGSSPLFRSFSPGPNSSRTFPQLSDILNNSTTLGERLPGTNRTMIFCVTARDNHPGGGGVASATAQVTVNGAAGPFRVTAPATSVSWSGFRTVTWDVAGTTKAPINAATVNILVSTDGGSTFPIVLAGNAPNSGVANVLLPNISTATARIRVQAADNIFFDISDGNFVIKAVPVLSLRLTNRLATLTWNSEAGKTYRVQFQDSLCATWTSISPDILSTNSLSTVSYPVNGASQRFYRLIQIP